MASTDLDEFVLNFDLNHLAAEENIQSSTQKYEKLRKTTSWLKSRIISTDFAIQKYQSKKDDYEQSVKALSVTREELKQVCINYKDASDKCTILENENKLLLGNQDILKERAIDIETKYDALISHTNQLQMLVKQLENEKDALTVEKELDKCNNKDNNQEIIVLQKEKDAILNDLLALKNVVLGKRKPCKKHIKIVKKYMKDIKSNGSIILCSSEESDDDISNYISSPAGRKLNEDHYITDKELTSSADQNFVDNYSDGEISVDTGRGSSRANSHDKFHNSPEYMSVETQLKLPLKDVITHTDAANSPIIIYPPRSVATSPIIFNHPIHLFEDQYDDHPECFDGPEYVINDTPLSEEIDILVEQEKLADCASPEPHMSNLINTEKSFETCNFLKDSAISSLEKSVSIESGKSNEFNQDTIMKKQMTKSLCEKSNNPQNNQETFIGACLSPVSKSSNLQKFFDIETNFAEHNNKSSEFKTPTSRNCDKATSTDTITLSERKNYVNACTSPIGELHDCCKCVMVNTMECENQLSRTCDKSTNTVTLVKKKYINASTSTTSIPLEQYNVIVTPNSGLPFKEQRETTRNLTDRIGISLSEDQRCLNKNKISKLNTNTIEKLRSQEKVCLESNSSKNLHFENTNDIEVQNILNVMKLRHDLISPISKTPSDSSQYLKLIPEMNCTLTKIWTTIANVYKMPHQLRSHSPTLLNSTEVLDLEENLEIETFNNKRKTFKQQSPIVSMISQAAEDVIIDTSHRTSDNTNSADTGRDIFSAHPNVPISENSNIVRSKCDVFAKKLFPDGRKVDITLTKDCPDQKEILTSPDLNKNVDNNLNNTNNTDEHTLTEVVDIDKDKRCTANHFELNESYEDNSINNTTCTNKTDICNTSEGHLARTIIIHGTKTKKKSKLEKFRNKLLPTCKIKKITPSIIKHSSKSLNLKPRKTTTTLSLEQKIAYENAVKVMAKLRSNQELQDKKKQLESVTGHANLENKTSKIDTSCSEAVELKMLSTRSRTRRFNKKNEDTTVTLNLKNKNIKDIEKSPVNRKVRKRPADTEVNSLQNNCKRILRSSNVPQVTNEFVLPLVQNDNTGVQPQKELGNKSESKENVKDVIYSYDSLNECSKPMNDDQDDNLNVENCNYGLQNKDLISAKSDITLENSVTGRLKPVIELSECLADNANLVSIVPGNVGYLDVNKNINLTNKSAAYYNTHMPADQKDNSNKNQLNLGKNEGEVVVENLVISSNTNPCIEEDTKTIQDISHKDLTIKKDANYTNVNQYSNDDQMATSEVSKQNNQSINFKQSLQAQQNDIPVTKLGNINSLALKLRDKSNINVTTKKKNDIIASKNNIVSYSDLDLYTTESNVKGETTKTIPKDTSHRKENILCAALDRYGVISVKYAAKKVPDAITLKICHKIEESIEKIIASAKAEQKSKMNELVNNLQNFKTKHILAGLMKYLKDPTRKNELFNKIINGPAPPMTRPEVILLYVIESLNATLPNGFINRLWNNIEHALFQLNRAPEFDVLESMSHFYAVLCRYFRNKSRLRCFMLDAMYCLQFKAVPLIRQCLDVCPGVLPNSHERMAKTSLVTCLVYLLHFYKCQDKFNRAQDIRNILYRKYQYRFSEWNETMILEIFRKAIMDLRGTHNDKKMLRVALIILCKRHGAKWCQLNIIQNILLPIIEKKDVPERIKHFCVLMLGPLLKPFPADRKAQCEIVINQLLQMLKQNTSQEMKEAIYSSLIFMNKHDQDRVVQALLSWNPENVSSDFEEILNDYVMEKPLAMWKKIVTRKPSQCT